MTESPMGEQSVAGSAGAKPLFVTVQNFPRAETHTYLARYVAQGAFGGLNHARDVADVHKQDVVRMNRDTIYSMGVFDLDAGPVTITLPDAGGRFMSLLTVNEDHYNPIPTIYTAGPHLFSREQIGTRYLFVMVRTFVDQNDPADLAAVHKLQDEITVDQASAGKFAIPAWDEPSLTRVRNALKALAPGAELDRAFGTPDSVDTLQHLIATAGGWGGNPPQDAQYRMKVPVQNDGNTFYRVTVRDVPVDAFWSVSVYNEDGYFVPNPENAYSLNNVTAQSNDDGSFTIQFGGCGEGVRNCLPIVPGWNCSVRMYRPRQELLDGTWDFPELQPVI